VIRGAQAPGSSPPRAAPAPLRVGTPRRSRDARSASSSVYEGRYQRENGADWTPVGEFDAIGVFIPEPGWERRVGGGWMPLEELLHGRG
jgi:hypothetical protein